MKSLSDVLLAALLLLVIPVSAFAHEAWIMWSQPTDAPWVLQSAYTTAAECIRVLDEKEATALRGKFSVQRYAKTDLVLLSNDGRGSRWSCFPATFDPSGPKGGGR